VNLNSRQLLQDCLNSVYQHTHDIEFEVIVVDNASSDGSVEMVKQQFPQAHVIENTVNNRYAIANNQGLDMAQGRYILYLNGDTVLLGNTVKEMMEFLDAHSQVGGVGGHLIYPDGAYQDACFRFPSTLNVFYLLCLSRFYWKTGLAASYPQMQAETAPQPVDFVMGACLMARRDVLQQVQGMDEDYYFYGEDSDLCYRIWQAGRPVYHLPQSTPIIHYGGVSSTINLFDNDQRRKHVGGWQSRFLFIKKHYPFWRRMGIVLAVLSALGVNGILYGLAAVKRRDWQYARVNMGAHLATAQAAYQIVFHNKKEGCKGRCI
jgi:GT2 family glycosyltransferase